MGAGGSKTTKGGGKGHGTMGREAKKINRGRLQLICEFKDKYGAQCLSVELLGAKQLAPMTANVSASPRVTMYLEPDPTSSHHAKHTSQTFKNNLNPKFDDKVLWEVPSKTDMEHTRLHVVVGHVQKKHEKFMGSMSFTLAEVMDGETPTGGWFKLLDKKRGETQSQPFRKQFKRHISAADAEQYVSVRGRKGPKRKARAAINMAPSSVALENLTGDSFNYLKLLGAGCFGKVLLAEHKESKDVYAIKVLKKLTVLHDDDVEGMMAERKVLTFAAGCPFLCKLYASFQTDSRLYFVMDFINGGDLAFHRKRIASMAEEDVRFYIAEIVIALWFLHDQGIVYRDLKPENVLLSADGHVKVADFGLVKEGIWGKATTTTFAGTPNYMAPEMIKMEPYNCSVDYWSLGVVGFELFVGEPPYENPSDEELYYMICNSTPDYPDSMSGPAMSFLNQLMARVPSLRLGCSADGREELVAHPFFQGMSWEDARACKMKPPFLPAKKGDRATDNFRSSFTQREIKMTPSDWRQIEDIDQTIFDEFSIVNHDAFVSHEVAAKALVSDAPLKEYKWYRPDLNREAVTKELRGKAVGTFMLRESGSRPGCYVLSVSVTDKVWHGIIYITTTAAGDKLYKLHQRNKFDDLPALVKHYHTNIVGLDKKGERFKLTGGLSGDDVIAEEPEEEAGE